MSELINFHYDFIKFKLYNVNRRAMNWDRLVPHKNLNNHYSLNSNGQFFDKNFDLFIDKGNNVTIRSSLPYLKYGHNYRTFDEKDLSHIIESLSFLLGVDLIQGRVLEIEFGAYQKIEISPKNLIDMLIGLKDYDLEKATQSLKMFGDNQGLHFKIYDPIKNAKSKKTFSISKYPEDDLIKYELKFLRFKGKALNSLCNNETFLEFEANLKRHIRGLIVQKEFRYLPIESSVNHILYSVLKNLEQQSGISVYSQVSKVLDKMQLSASQKSKRKKSLMSLEKIYNEEVVKR